MRILLYTVILLLCASCVVFSQGIAHVNYYDTIKKYDLSKLWCADSVLNMELIDNAVSYDPLKFSFPEPLGFIGNNYQRFYIHLLSVKKDKGNPCKYNVTGKTRVKEIICRFAGTITVDSAFYEADTMLPQFRRGYVVCRGVFYEDSSKPESGCITGTMETDWCIYRNKIYYDNVYGAADGYSNNEFTGSWKSYRIMQVKKCNWGDWRIPQSGDLDGGAGEFSVDDKYLKYGWQTYRDAGYCNDTVKQKKALREEYREWWK